MGAQKNRLNEHPKHMLKMMDKKIITILHSKILLNWTYGVFCHSECNKVMRANFMSNITFPLHKGQFIKELLEIAV